MVQLIPVFAIRDFLRCFITNPLVFLYTLTIASKILQNEEGLIATVILYTYFDARCEYYDMVS